MLYLPVVVLQSPMHCWRRSVEWETSITGSLAESSEVILSTAQYMMGTTAVQLWLENWYIDHTAMNFSGSQRVVLRNASIPFKVKVNTHVNVQCLYSICKQKQGVSKCPTPLHSIGKLLHGSQAL